MGDTFSILVISDIHFASAAEKKRGAYEVNAIANPFSRLFVKFYRRYIWLANPFDHNHLLDIPLSLPDNWDAVVVNGDYSCDSAFIGLMDPPSRQSAEECLAKLRGQYGNKLWTTHGDHEFGKTSLAGNHGGLRFESYKVASQELAIPRYWKFTRGRYVFAGITSTLVALPAFYPEILPPEMDRWKSEREAHLAEVRELFRELKEDQRLVLFCHDPTALPYLLDEASVVEKLHLIEHTVIGHLHTNLIYRKSRLLAGLPRINFLGKSISRITGALNRAKCWKPFRVLLCPSLPGCQLLKDGGYLTIKADAGGKLLAIKRHRIRW